MVETGVSLEESRNHVYSAQEIATWVKSPYIVYGVLELCWVSFSPAVATSSLVLMLTGSAQARGPLNSIFEYEVALILKGFIANRPLAKIGLNFVPSTMHTSYTIFFRFYLVLTVYIACSLDIRSSYWSRF